MGNEFTTTTADANEWPISYADVLEHLRLLEDGNYPEFINALIAAATDYAETRMGCTLVQRERTVTFDANQPWRLPAGPVVEITSIVDADERAITSFTLHKVGLIDRLSVDVPYTLPVTVVYQAGYDGPGNVPASIRLALLQHVGTMYEARESTTDKPRVEVPHSLDAFYRLKARHVGVK